MRDSIVKFILVLILIVLCLLAFGQSENGGEMPSGKDYINLLFEELSRYDQDADNENIKWCLKTCIKKRYMSILHVPSQDFNIYLTFTNSVTPTIRTSLEVSLNYAGVMNIKNLIFLRKKSTGK